MTIQSPARRLRLFILSLSLFCSSVAAGIVRAQTLVPPQVPPGITVRNAKFDTITAVTSENGSIVGAPGSNPNRLPLPVDGSVVRTERREFFVYSMELTNDGPKPIKALSWDYIFLEPGTQTEALRRSFGYLQKIDQGQKKTVKFTTQLGTPKTVDVAALGKDPKSWFKADAQIQCVLFADGSTWERNTTGKPCERLERWLERRKTWRPGIEDLPFNP